MVVDAAAPRDTRRTAQAGARRPAWRRTRRHVRTIAGLALTGLVLAGLQAVSGGSAHAAVVTDLPSADALPTPQVNGIVFSVAVVGNTAYAAGNFSTARPAGVPLGGPGEVTRTNLLAFDLTTGALLPFNHTIEGTPFVSTTDPGPFCRSTGALNTWVCDGIFRVKASPDGKKVYIVGDFTKVDGVNRYRAAAFDATTGALDPTFKPAFSSRVRAIAFGTSTVYLGGSFTLVSGATRTRLAAIDANGAVVAGFAPSADNEVWAAALSQSQDRLVVGGKFATLDGTAIPGLGSVFTADGSLAPWSSQPVTRTKPSDPSYISDIQISGSTAFFSGVGRGGYPAFEGRAAADVATGNLLWIDECHGDTQSIAVAAGVVFSATHAHDCSRIGDAPISDWNGRNSWVFQRLLAENADPQAVMPSGQTVSKLESWFPTVDAGPATSYWKNGSWAVAADGVNVVVGGEFLTVNGVAQQGLTRFVARSHAPRKVAPSTPWPAPLVASPVAGQIRVSWLTTWDRDNPTVGYQLFRDNVLIWTSPAVAATFWSRPTLTYTDGGLVAGSAHSYRVRAVDPDGNAIGSPSSAPVTVLGGTPRADDYAAQVVADAPLHYWRLATSAGTDVTGGLPLTYGTGAAAGQPGGVNGTTDASTTFDGTVNGIATTTTAQLPPTALSIEAWFRTTSTAGGRILGFGTSGSVTPSVTDDRHLYLTSDGRVNFGVVPSSGTFQKIGSSRSYSDGGWHQAVATLGPAGMVLYVDGAVVATKATITAARSYSGFWRVGGDTLTGWTAAYWGDPTLQSVNWPWPTSDDLAGSVDDAAVYGYALTADQVRDHYLRGAL